MRADACTETRKVEAARDGRLPQQEAALLRSHMRSCTLCMHEHARLDALQLALRASATPATDAELERLRERVLWSASDVALPQRRRKRHWRVGLLAFGTLAMLGLGYMGARVLS